MTTEANKIAALSAEPAQEMTDERICDLMGWNVEAMQQNEPEDLPTRVRALVRVAEAEAVAANRASRLPEITDEQIEDAIDHANRKFNAYRSSGPRGQQVTTKDDWKHWLAREIEALVRGKT